MKKSKIIGAIFMLVSFGFILREISRMDISSLQIKNPVQAIFIILLFTVLTIGSVILTAVAWKSILTAIHGGHIEFAEVFKVYVKANVAKYLPGNVLHYAGRNIIGSRLGWKHSDILLSSILEVLMILVSAAIFLLLFSYKQFKSVIMDAVHNAVSNPAIPFLIAAVLIVVTAGILFLYYKRTELWDKLKLLFSRRFLKVYISNFFLYTGTFLIQGIVMVFIFTGVFQIGSIDTDLIMLVTSSTVLSWFAGFITPGAPGGLGVKEAVLLLMLSPVYGREYTLAAALMHRFISVLADVAALGVGLVMEKRILLQDSAR